MLEKQGSSLLFMRELVVLPSPCKRVRQVLEGIRLRDDGASHPAAAERQYTGDLYDDARVFGETL